MAESAVTFLLNKLALLLQEEENLLRGFRGEMVWIKDELERMKAFLRVADSMEDDDEEVKVWVKQVRYAAYDTEDVLDEFNLRFQHHPKGKGCLPACRKASSSVKNLKARHEIASDIKSIKSRIKDISEGFRRYRLKLEVAGNATSSSSVAGNNDLLDRRGDALLIEEADLVGIAEPKRQLVEWLLKGDSRMNVVSVVGMGGLGKTTLIKKVYDDVQVKNHFLSHAWINISQSFKLEELLRGIIRQLFNEMIQPVPEGVDTMNRDQLKATIKEFLKERRYVIVLDDVWNINDWEGFRYTLPNNNSGSRVLLTTRVAKVASKSSIESFGHVHILKPLSSEESWTLFCRKTFRADFCPPDLIKLSESILKRCNGLPLAIVAISGVLSTKDSNKIDEWEMIHRSLGSELESNDGFKSTKKIMLLGFNDLPYYLKSCFLYLSIFPEDYMIDRMRLIRLWMAEGFVKEKQGKTREEVADGYLNELLNRSMIQVAEVAMDGRVKTCRVHDLIREIILSKSKDEIFVAANEPNPIRPERIRCISVHNSISNLQQIRSSTSRLRSLLMFGLVDSLSSLFMASFSGMNLKLLTVLDLTGAPLEIFPEDIIVQLINLRYLSLRDTKLTNLPNSIGKLRNLETLDLKRSCITELPVKILKLKQLRHLLLYHYEKPGIVRFPSIYGFKAPSGIGGLSSLQKLTQIEANLMLYRYSKPTLYPFPVVYGFKGPSGIGGLSSLQKLTAIEASSSSSGSSSLVKEIGSLTQLTRLGLTKLRKEDGETLCSSIGKLRNIRSLSLQSIQEDEIIDLQYLASPPPYLRILELVGRLEKLPHWIPSAHSLVRIYLKWSRLKEDPLESLGDLPTLVWLHLLAAAYDGTTLRFKSGGFQRLKELTLHNLEELRTMRVEDGAMPKLENLYIFRCKLLESVPSGIASLSNLNILRLGDMSDKLIEMINPNQEGSAYSIIAHISRVQVANGEDYPFKEYKIVGNIEYYS